MAMMVLVLWLGAGKGYILKCVVRHYFFNELLIMVYPFISSKEVCLMLDCLIFMCMSLIIFSQFPFVRLGLGDAGTSIGVANI